MCNLQLFFDLNNVIRYLPLEYELQICKKKSHRAKPAECKGWGDNSNAVPDQQIPAQTRQREQEQCHGVKYNF
jgi:hypothetical protein